MVTRSQCGLVASRFTPLRHLVVGCRAGPRAAGSLLLVRLAVFYFLVSLTASFVSLGIFIWQMISISMLLKKNLKLVSSGLFFVAWEIKKKKGSIGTDIWKSKLAFLW